MRELISTLEHTLTWRERLLRAGDHCIGLTRWERLVRALSWIIVGQCVALVFGAIGRHLEPVPPVTLLDPVIEHTTDGYSAYRLRMQWRGTERSCELYVFHDRLTWRLTCEPR